MLLSIRLLTNRPLFFYKSIKKSLFASRKGFFYYLLNNPEFGTLFVYLKSINTFNE